MDAGDPAKFKTMRTCRRKLKKVKGKREMLLLHYQVNFNPNWIWRDVVVVRSSKPAVGIFDVPMISFAVGES